MRSISLNAKPLCSQWPLSVWFQWTAPGSYEVRVSVCEDKKTDGWAAFPLAVLSTGVRKSEVAGGFMACLGWKNSEGYKLRKEPKFCDRRKRNDVLSLPSSLCHRNKAVLAHMSKTVSANRTSKQSALGEARVYLSAKVSLLCPRAGRRAPAQVSP